jgi:hypothetical protein
MILGIKMKSYMQWTNDIKGTLNNKLIEKEGVKSGKVYKSTFLYQLFLRRN